MLVLAPQRTTGKKVSKSRYREVRGPDCRVVDGGALCCVDGLLRWVVAEVVYLVVESREVL